MSQLVEHLAELTGFRDRDVLDTTLAAALRDILHPRSVGIYRCVGEEHQRRWLTRARLTGNDAAATADPLWADLDTLPLLADHPERLAAIEQQAVVVVSGVAVAAAVERTVFPLTTDREVIGVVEVDSDTPLDAEQQRLVCSVLRIYRNFQGLLDYSERDTLTG
ncbi:MAG: GGDEF domain-containing protein, partial [Burkholderiales bacterium]|nr:GGDEF domain-containing protein [Burkholderiales bacterium]